MEELIRVQISIGTPALKNLRSIVYFIEMKELKQKYKNLDRFFIESFLVATGLLIVSLGFNFIAGTYATARAGAPVGDIILDNIPVFNLDWAFVYGPVLFWLVMAVVCFREPKTLPFVLKAIALFVIIRSVFVTLTHLGVSSADIPPDASSNFVKRLAYGGGLFFSGHTGLPFLMSLIFKDNIYLRIFCLVAAVFFGVIVLMVHMHYSIDVLAAFFITYTIYCLAEMFFKKDRDLFHA